MFITDTKPLINLTLNGAPASLCRGIGEKTDGKAHLTVTGTRRSSQSDEYYHPLSLEGLPTEDDKSDFAELYFLLQMLVEHGLLSGPYGDNHPALYNYFEYPSTEFTVEELLDELTGLGVAVSDIKVDYSSDWLSRTIMRVEYGKSLEAKAEMMAEACKVLGKYLKPDTEVIYPEIIENPKLMTSEGRAALFDDARESFTEKVFSALMWLLCTIAWLSVGWWGRLLSRLYWRLRYGPLK